MPVLHTPAGRAATYRRVTALAAAALAGGWIDWTGEITAARRPGGPWQPRDRYGRWTRLPLGLRRRADLAVRYSTGIARVRQRITRGESALVEIVELGDGSLAVRKQVRELRPDDPDVPVTSVDAEELAAVTAEAFGLNSPGVLRTGQDTLVMDYVDGVTRPEDHLDSMGRAVPALRDSDQGRLMGLFDHVVANIDRHSYNWMFADGQVVAIDHGLAWFPYEVAERPGKPVMAGSEFARHFVARHPQTRQLVWADNDMTPRDMAVLLDRMRELRPEFDRLGRLAWWEWTVAQLGAIAQHAKGARDRVR